MKEDPKGPFTKEAKEHREKVAKEKREKGIKSEPMPDYFRHRLQELDETIERFEEKIARDVTSKSGTTVTTGNKPFAMKINKKGEDTYRDLPRKKAAKVIKSMKKKGEIDEVFKEGD
jgi:hypothetical protein